MQVRKQQLELDMEQHCFQIGQGVCQGSILSPCLFNLYAEYIMRNAGLGPEVNQSPVVEQQGNVEQSKPEVEKASDVEQKENAEESTVNE